MDKLEKVTAFDPETEALLNQWQFHVVEIAFSIFPIKITKKKEPFSSFVEKSKHSWPNHVSFSIRNNKQHKSGIRNWKLN